MTGDRLPKNLRRREAVEKQHHVAYWHDLLGAAYCEADGEPWPCLADRQTDKAKCLCGHRQHPAGQCWSAACGCAVNRPDLAIPARFDERYDPSPEPIDRKIQ